MSDKQYGHVGGDLSPEALEARKRENLRLSKLLDTMHDRERFNQGLPTLAEEVLMPLPHERL